MAGRGLPRLRTPSCPTCKASRKLYGFADETIRNGSYGIAVLIVCGCRLESLRRAARSLFLPGQHRLHCSKEQDPRRKTILSTIASLSVFALYATERGNSLDARTACWHVLIPKLLALNVNELVIESLEGVEARDKGDIGDALRKADRMGSLGYSHRTHRAEPILWLADAVAWAAGARGDWQRRIAGILLRG